MRLTLLTGATLSILYAEIGAAVQRNMRIRADNRPETRFGGCSVIQLDGSTELEAILDGVFKPVKREERRQRQRYARKHVAHHPVLVLNYPGAGGTDMATGGQIPEMHHAPAQVRVATTEDLIQSGHLEAAPSTRMEERVINPPPPEVPSTPADAAADLYGQGYIRPSSRIWS